MSDIRFYNRYSGQEETEVVYGEGFLRWTYETTMGKIGLWVLAKRVIFSHWYGWRMNKDVSAERIRPFIEHYRLDENEFLEATESYSSFNDFFYRKLKDSARPLVRGTNEIALPADARHLGVPNLGEVDGLFAKGQFFDLKALLGSVSLSDNYPRGAAVISRLCPVDYHRYHSPVAGRIVEQRLINGPLFSVSPIALRQSMGYLWENKRILTVIETPDLGKVCFVAIGATCVGSIFMTAKEGETVEKGGELGYFAFGGSCVITIFEHGRVKLADDLVEYGSKQLEVYARVGDLLGTAVQ
ncbi:archaetidylserine decarboxylase [Pelagicoccus sp. SDUM812002]|uniref:archaetidylserine decarboxylase n=1 Tax=Pelagicoccus sp. SDUM812002 TaxID=3041266 RepID=UPI00280CB63F|nr:archaetidylserine decarboxylase [Pelagicoccus sp. SDUM812002]MDQ8185387.1 archaetidylserine decarboxylase [Pelagicoccus sp. SDUM812002]